MFFYFNWIGKKKKLENIRKEFIRVNGAMRTVGKVYLIQCKSTE